MTIILATPQVLLADSRTTWGNTLTSDPQKVHRAGAALFGLSGDWGACDAFVAWAQRQEDWLTIDAANVTGTGECDALILLDGHLWWADQSACGLHPMPEPAWAIGSGREIALGAVWAGASLLTAMAIACERASGCGWPIRWYTPDGAEGLVTREEWHTGDYDASSAHCETSPYAHGLRDSGAGARR